MSSSVLKPFKENYAIILHFLDNELMDCYWIGSEQEMFEILNFLFHLEIDDILFY